MDQPSPTDALPSEEASEEEGIGLALSGGGFRAMLFHLGSAWRINELRMLGGLNRISGVSGGSIFLGRLASSWRRLEFQEGSALNFQEEVAAPVMKFSETLIDAPAAIIGTLTPLSTSRIAARYYRRLVDDTSLDQLPDVPRFVFNASHFPSASSWRFSKPYMGSYRLGLIPAPKIALATAIAASAAFPPFLSPLTLRLDPDSFIRTRGSDLYDQVELRKKVPLTDGGVYDNLGLETVWRRYRTVLSSDAGGPLTVKPGGYSLWHTQLFRAYDAAGEQARAMRRRVLVEEFLSKKKLGTLWRTATDISDYPRPSPFPVHPDWREHLATMRTRLNRFRKEEQAHLVNWGYLVTDVALRSWVVRDADPPKALPFPEYDFAAPPKKKPARIGGPGERDEE